MNIHDRSEKLRKRRARMPVNGIAMKRLLIERAAQARRVTMARYWCARCKTESNTLDGEHLCADIAKRLARREKQATAVEALLAQTGLTRRERAEAIVQKLSQLGVSDD